MSNKPQGVGDDEISLADIWRLLQRQKVFIFLIFAGVAVSAFSVAISRPSTWESSVDLMVGERLFFLQPQQLTQAQPQTQQQIESTDEIIHQYASSEAVIAPVKKTRIIKITSTAETQEAATAQLTETVTRITSTHQKLLEEKKAEFVALLDAVSKDTANRTELVRLLDNASNSSATRQLSAISSEYKAYGGLLFKITGAGVAAGLFLALLLAVGKDFIEQSRTHLGLTSE